MNRKNTWGLLLLTFLFLAPAVVNAQILDPVKWDISLEPKANEEFEIVANCKIENKWHIYALTVSNDPDAFALPTSIEIPVTDSLLLVGRATEGKFITHYDPNFEMDLNYFEQQASFRQKVKLNAADPFQLEVIISYMACDDKQCIMPEPPVFHLIANETPGSLRLQNGPMQRAGEQEDLVEVSEIDPFVIAAVDLDNPKSDCGESVEEDDSLWGIFIFGIIGGLLALLTPCVFPMIPLTVSFFTKGSGGKNGRVRAITYGVFIFLIYAVLSLPFHLSKNVDPEVLNMISTSAGLNISFFIIFIVFAISFFGYFEITLPNSMANKVDNASNLGGLMGIFFMALTLAIVSFSCTGPILGTVIGSIYATDTTGYISILGMDLFLPATKITAAMSGFGIALGLPFGLFAAFPGWLNNLPKSGGWLNIVKVSLGFAEVALALKFFSNADLVMQWGILKREVFFAAWIIIGVLWVMYLLGKFRFPHDSKNAKIGIGRRVMALAVGLFVLYLVPGLTNTKYANLGLLSGFPPPMSYSIYEKEADIHVFHDFDEAKAYAAEHNKPMLVDFTGWACVNCRRMEENVWATDRVKQIIKEEYVLVSLYVDEKILMEEEEQFTYITRDGRKKQIKTIGDKWTTLQTETFRNNSQPFYALMSADEELLTPPKKGYQPDVEEYAEWLECGVASHKK